MLNNQWGVYKAYGYNNVTSTAIWNCSQSSTPSGAFLSAQSDSNLVVYSSSNTVLWKLYANSPNPPGIYCLQILNNGTLIWKNSTNGILWY